jgi:spermidine/putrescine-binding protein
MKKFLSIVSIMLLMVSFVGCGKKDEKTADGYSKELNLFIWSEYVSDDAIKGFEDKYGIKVNVSYFTSTDEMNAKLMSGNGKDYDLVQAGNSQIENLVNQKYIQELDFNNISNIKNINKSALNQEFDPEQKYSVEYLSSYTVIGYNKNTCPVEIKSIKDLLNPALKDTIVSITSSRRIMAMVLDSLGYDPNTKDENQIKEATDFLKEMKENVKIFDGDAPRKSLLNGECSVALIYNGDLAIAMNEQPDTYEVANIDTGYVKASNQWCVPTGAAHKREAELFIDYMLEPEVMAKNLDVYPYNCPNDEALKVVSEQYKKNPALNLSEETMKKAVSIKEVGETEVVYDKYWSEFMSK